MEIGSLLNCHTPWDAGQAQPYPSIASSQSAPGTPVPHPSPPAPRRDAHVPAPRPHSSAAAPLRPPSDSVPKGATMYTPSLPSISSSPVRSSRNFHPEASLILVGIRGCGKRSLGFIAAAALGRRLVTEDHYFQAATGLSRQDYLRHNGSRKFHERDVEVSRKMLDDNKMRCVIECGLGSLTSSVQEHLREYSATNPVVYLLRDMAEIIRLLRLDDRSARLLENGDPTHRRCSNYEFYNLEDHTTDAFSDGENSDRRSPSYSFKLKDAKEDFTYFVRFITGASNYRSNYDSPFSLLEMPVDLRLYTHALEIRYSDVEDGRVDFNQLESAGDVIEICVDRWTTNTVKHLSRLVAEVRRKIGVPIIFAAEYGEQITSDEIYVGILEHGLRLGVEFISVDLGLEDSRISRLVASKGFTRVIGHTLEFPPAAPSWDDEKWITRYDRAQALGCDVIRLLQFASSREDNETLRKFTEKVRGRSGICPPLIAYNVGALGRTSQIFNPILTSVTHSAIERGKAEDYVNGRPLISSKEAVRALFQSFVLDPLKFYVLGVDVSYSLSPAMYNAAYQELGMDHTYVARNITSLADLETLAQDPHFGGASIAQPWKVATVDQLASKSRHAEAIGAVNTLLPLRAQADGSVFSLQNQASQRNRAGQVVGWYGDNTDWIGIMVCLTKNLSPMNVIKPLKTTGLVIGAGGMARASIYAMLRLGCRQIFIHNRTVANAEKVADHFNSWTSSGIAGQSSEAMVRVLRSTQDAWPTSYAFPTMIVSCIPALGENNQATSKFELPTQWIQSSTGGAILGMAYKAVNTPLFKQMRKIRKERGTPWVLVDFMEILPEQATAQFELMTGRKAPRARMKGEVLRSYEGSDDGNSDSKE